MILGSVCSLPSCKPRMARFHSTKPNDRENPFFIQVCCDSGQGRHFAVGSIGRKTSRTKLFATFPRNQETGEHSRQMLDRFGIGKRDRQSMLAALVDFHALLESFPDL